MSTCYLCSRKRSKEITLHKFPSDSKIRDTWFEACGLSKERDDVSRTKICSDHFRPEDYVEPRAKLMGNRLILRKKAFPSISVPYSVYSTVNVLDEDPSPITEVEVPHVATPDEIETSTISIPHSPLFLVKVSNDVPSPITFEEIQYVTTPDEIVTTSPPISVPHSPISAINEPFEVPATEKVENSPLLTTPGIVEEGYKTMNESFEVPSMEKVENSSLLTTPGLVDTGYKTYASTLTGEVDEGLQSILMEFQSELCDTANQECDESIETFNTPKKRRFAYPRFISEITASDVSTPRRARQVLHLIRRTDGKKTKKIKTLQMKNSYLLKRIATLQKLVKHSNNNKSESEEAGSASMTTDMSTHIAICHICGYSEFEVEKMHWFPKAVERAKSWQRSLGMKYIDESVRHMRICSRHFTADSYKDYASHKLRPDAIPTLFPITGPPARVEVRDTVPAKKHTAEAVVSIDLTQPSNPPAVIVENVFETEQNKFPVPLISQNGGIHEEPMTNNVESTEEYNLWNSCRVCLAISENMVLLGSPLFEERDDNKTTEITILEAIEKLMSQKLFLHEKWPLAICETCRQLLKQAYRLNILFHYSQESLNEIFKNNVPKNQHMLDHTYISETIESIDKSGNGEEQNVHLEAEEKEKNFETKPDEDVTKNGSDINSTGKILSTNLVKNNRHRRLFPCCFCDRVCSRMKHLINHMTKCPLRPVVHSCTSCGAKNKVIGDRNEFLCDGCGAVSKVPKSRDFLCYVCGRTFNQKQRTLHMRTHGARKFECEICDKKFRYKTTLKAHHDMHKNIRNHLCNICGQAFCYRSGLVYHMQRKHTNERKFICEICDKGFLLRLDLVRHLKSHNNRPFACGFCGKVCRTGRGSRTHELMHSGERPHKCRFCERTFIYRPNLAMHEMTHPGSYECYHCDKTFIEVDLLNRHVRIKHKTKDIVE